MSPHALSEEDFSVLRHLYNVLTTFADVPERVLDRLKQPRFMIWDDLASEINHWHSYFVNKYPAMEDLQLLQTTARIIEIFDRYSGEQDWFWTHKGYLGHPEWDEIRQIARGFLLR